MNEIKEKVEELNKNKRFTDLLKKLHRLNEMINSGEYKNVHRLEGELFDTAFDIETILIEKFPNGFWSGVSDNFVATVSSEARYELKFDCRNGKVILIKMKPLWL